MSKASQQLRESEDPEQQALGAYIFSLIDKHNPVGRGKTKRELLKEGWSFREDADICGQFRVRVDDPNFDQLFAARANR